MAIALPYPSRFAAAVDNFPATPTTTPGTAITSGTANTKGSWANVLSALGYDVHGFYVRISDIGSAAVQRNYLVDIGIDRAGGSSYSVHVPDLLCGNAGPMTIGGNSYEFICPMFVPAGSTVAARGQGNGASIGARVGIRAYGRPTAPWLPLGRVCEVIGSISNTDGVSFTPGNGTDGAWQSLGTLTRRAFCLQLGYQIASSNTSAEKTWIELAWGDGSNKHIIRRLLHVGTGAEQISPIMAANVNPFEAFGDWAAGVELFVRGHCENAPDSGYQALAYAFAA